MIRRLPLVFFCVMVHGVVFSSDEAKTEAKPKKSKKCYELNQREQAKVRAGLKSLSDQDKKTIQEVDLLSSQRANFIIQEETDLYLSEKRHDISGDAEPKDILTIDDVLQKIIQDRLSADKILSLLAEERRNLFNPLKLPANRLKS